MGCDIGTNMMWAGLSGGTSSIFDIAQLGENGPADTSDPLVTEALHTLNAYRTVAPEQLKVMSEFNPKFAEQYGKDMASIYAGTLPTYENLISPALSRVNTQQRGADIADVATLGPKAREAILASNPDSAKLLATLNEQANTGLAAGTRLRPDDLSAIKKSVRGNYAGRGFDSAMPASDLEEAMQMYLGGQNVQNQRRSFAGNVLGYNQQVVGDPFMQILSRSGQSVGAANQLYGQGQGQYDQSGAGQYDPFKDAYSTMFHNQDISLAKDNANKQLAGAVIGGLLGSAGTVGLAAMCWAAREVFGAADSRWLEFRHWLLHRAPVKFRDWYLENGEAWAHRLRTNPFAKAVVKRWMERRIASYATT